MHATTRAVRSRDRWRDKAKERSVQGCESRKEVKRQLARVHMRDEKIRDLSEQVAAARAEVAAFRQRVSTIASPPVSAQQTRARCVVLVIFAVISFRAVPRVLALMALWSVNGLQWIPHFTSVINWTLRVGLSLLTGVQPIADPWVAIIDMSIDVAVKKALVVLRVKLSALADRGGAIALADAQCVGVEVSESWNGVDVAAALGRIFAKAGNPAAILKDKGGDLRKGARLWQEDEKNAAKDVKIIDDVGHVAANALKAMFAKLDAFKKMLAAATKGAAKIRQSQLAYLTPPKIRTKGRFQSISKLATWGIRILDIIGGSGRKEDDSTAAKLQEFMPGFGVHRPILHRLAWCTTIINGVLDVLKNGGLCSETYDFSKKMLGELPETCKARRKLFAWLEDTWRIHQSLGIDGLRLPVSSDILESLFGKLKVMLARNPKAEFNRIILATPCLCGTLDEAAVDRALREISHQDLERWEAKKVGETQHRKRRAAFAELDAAAGPKVRKAG